MRKRERRGREPEPAHDVIARARTCCVFVAAGLSLAGCDLRLPHETQLDAVPTAATVTKLGLTVSPATLPADGASVAILSISGDTAAPASVGLTTTAGTFAPGTASTLSVTLAGTATNAFLVAPKTIGDSMAIVSASLGGVVLSATIPLTWAYPQQVLVSPDNFAISDTLDRRTLTVSAVRVPGVVTRGTPVQFYAHPSGVPSSNASVGTFDLSSVTNASGETFGPAFTDSTGTVTVHYSLNGDHGAHRDSVTIFAVVRPTPKDSVVGRVTLYIAPPAAPIITPARQTSSFRAPIGGAATPGVDTIYITNGGTGVLNGLALGQTWYATDTTSWVKANLVLGGASSVAYLALSVNPAGLALGGHMATVPITSTSPGVSNPAMVTVTLTISPPPDPPE